MERYRGAGETQGQKGKGALPLQPGASLHGAQRSPLPFQLCSGPASQLPHPSAPGRVRGNTLPRGLSEPERRGCQRVPRTPASTPTPARHHRLPPPQTVLGTPFLSGACASWAESRLSKNPDITSHPAPLWQDRQTISAQRGISPRSRPGTGERTEQEDNPSPRLKPLSQLTRCGARRGGGAKEPCVGREEARGRGGERDRGRSGDRRE